MVWEGNRDHVEQTQLRDCCETITVAPPLWFPRRWSVGVGLGWLWNQTNLGSKSGSTTDLLMQLWASLLSLGSRALICWMGMRTRLQELVEG